MLESDKQTRRRRGFSLLEIVISFFLISTAAFTALQLFPTATNAMHQGKTVVQATHIARAEVELAEANYSLFIPSDLAVHTYSPTQLQQTVTLMTNGSSENITYTPTWVYSTDSTSNGHNLVDITVTVSWRENSSSTGFSSVPRSVSMRTKVSN